MFDGIHCENCGVILETYDIIKTPTQKKNGSMFWGFPGKVIGYACPMCRFTTGV